MEQYLVKYGNNNIKFNIKRKNVKNINLNVKPDMSVVVSANEKVPVAFIVDFVKGKADWILKRQSYFANVQPDTLKKKKYLSGESFKYLGRQYRLRVLETKQKESVKYYRGYLYLIVKNKEDYKKKEILINDWYKMKAKEKFAESLDKMFQLVKRDWMEKPTIQSRVMKARWGSCLIAKKHIFLNIELIKAPKICIDYVILHELAHFLYKDHSREFYEFLTVIMPDWKARKAILDEEFVREL